jgi:hypothetical protein
MTDPALTRLSALIRSLEADPSSIGRHFEGLPSAISDLIGVATVNESAEVRRRFAQM